MPCDNSSHSHVWPTSGQLVIERCEIYCAFCTGERSTHKWKFAWFLRRHVRDTHAGRSGFEDLSIGDGWTRVDGGKTTKKKNASSGEKDDNTCKPAENRDDVLVKAVPMKHTPTDRRARKDSVRTNADSHSSTSPDSMEQLQSSSYDPYSSLYEDPEETLTNFIAMQSAAPLIEDSHVPFAVSHAGDNFNLQPTQFAQSINFATVQAPLGITGDLVYGDNKNVAYNYTPSTVEYVLESSNEIRNPPQYGYMTPPKTFYNTERNKSAHEISEASSSDSNSQNTSESIPQYMALSAGTIEGAGKNPAFTPLGTDPSDQDDSPEDADGIRTPESESDSFETILAAIEPTSEAAIREAEHLMSLLTAMANNTGSSRGMTKNEFLFVMQSFTSSFARLG